ncbi:MAG: TlpA family protein disulfide reductase [Planctomycetaceae bacterium]|nr:TlpA family protein disulfide reductase [Planctomycetaceae bacterium]
MIANTCPTRKSEIHLVAWGVSCVFLLGVIGCGKQPAAAVNPSASGDADSTQDSSPAYGLLHTSPTPPVAAIGGNREPLDDAFPNAAPEKGTAEWFLREVARIRTELSSSRDTPLTQAAIRTHHEKIIDLARQAIAVTHQDAERVQLFNNAVHYLTESRLALAIDGDREQSQLLIDDADSLYRRDPKSFAAIESAAKVVRLAQLQAERHGRAHPEWLKEFANQARLFAEKFPHEPNRCALVLLNAGQVCDREGLPDAAKSCFMMVQKLFPQTLFADQVNGLLRRLSLAGQPVELAGPTIEGGYVSIDDFQGRVVLVVFWAATSPQFEEDCSRIVALQEQHASEMLQVIGVNLDEDEADIDRFFTEQAVPWPHIFYSESEKRGGMHPLARYYGIHQVPTYWLVDRRGRLAAAPRDLEELTERLPELLAAP